LIPGGTATTPLINGDMVTFTVTLPTGFLFSDSTDLAVLHCTSFVADTMKTSIVFSYATVTTSGIICSIISAPPSSTFTLIPQCGDSIIAAGLSKSLPIEITSIRPNPATEDNALLELHTSFSGTMHVTVYDLLGREVAASTSQVSKGDLSYPLNLEGIGNGSYIVRVTAPNGTVASGKVLVKR